jgi:hypothetical protein
MAVKIRQRRMGAKKAPFYRIVVADSRLKTFTKTLALLLALLVAFGVSASAAEPPPEEWDGLPELKLGQTAGKLEGETTELWYRFTAEENGYYLFTVDGAWYDVYFVVSYPGEPDRFSFPDKGMIDDYASISAGETQYVRIFKPDNASDWEFTVTIEGPFSYRSILEEDFRDFFATFDNVGPIEFLAGIGTIPLAGILFGLFFAPYSLGGTLFISLISALFLPVTLLLSPFMLMQDISSLLSQFGIFR